MMDVLKLLAVAGGASGFFFTYALKWRITALVSGFIFFWISVAILPSKPPK